MEGFPGTACCEAVAAEITTAGGEALPLAADVTRRAEVRDAVDRTLAHFNRIDRTSVCSRSERPRVAEQWSLRLRDDVVQH